MTDTTHDTDGPRLRPGDHSDAALVAASLAAPGRPVIPLRPDTRTPLTDPSDPRTPDGKSGPRHARLWRTTDVDVLATADDFPAQYGAAVVWSCSWGIVLGEADADGWRVVVLDADTVAADARLVDLCRATPEGAAWLDSTLTVRTSRGWHHYGLVREPLATCRPWSGETERDALDVKAVGGYVVLPGNPHPRGTRYTDVTGEAGTVRTAGERPDVPGTVAVYRGVEIDPASGPVAVWSLVRPIPGAILDGLAVPLRPPEVATAPDGSGVGRPTLAGDGDDDGARRGQPLDPPSALRRLAGLIRSAAGKADGRRHTGAYDLGRMAAGLVVRVDPQARTGDLAPAPVRAAFVAALVSAGLEHADAERTVADGWAVGWRQPWRDDDREPQGRGGVADQVTPAARLLDEVLTGAEVEAFWQARGFLSTVHAHARARGLSPWSLLGTVLARVAASVPPTLALPGPPAAASLNLFVALVGVSGSGKSAALTAAGEVLDPRGALPYLVTSPGTGEGLLGAYVRTEKATGAKRARMVQHAASVLLHADEVGGLAALTRRDGATLGPFLRTAWTGGMLGTQNADPTRRRHLDAHHYRLALVVGVQPELADVLIGQEATASGFAQRFLWLPTYDPQGLAPSDERDVAARWSWQVPGPALTFDADVLDHAVPWPVPLGGRGPVLLTVPEVARATIAAAAAARNVPIGAPLPGDALDGHALLSRLKVAALLAVAEGRTTVSDADWELAAVVLEVSDATRAAVEAVLSGVRAREAATRAAQAGRTAVVVQRAVADDAPRRVARVLHRHLTAAAVAVARGRLRKAAQGKDRDLADAALALLVAEGGAVLRHGEGRQAGTAYYAAVAGWRP